jgi:hypothetical protein
VVPKLSSVGKKLPQILFEVVMDPVLEPMCLNLRYHIFEELVVLKHDVAIQVGAARLFVVGFLPQRIEVTVESIC